MFVQVIEGRVADREALRRLFDRWHAELHQGAPGWLGTTAGVTAAGRFIALVRFESLDAARSNSGRAEQGAWWTEVEKCFADAPRFRDTEDVEVIFGGGSDRAGFVQVMQGRATDPARVRGVEARRGDGLRRHRPDLIGGMRVWHGEADYTEVAYFTSEAEARQAEAKPLSEEARATFEEWQGAAGEVTFLDLPDPWLWSA